METFLNKSSPFWNKTLYRAEDVLSDELPIFINKSSEHKIPGSLTHSHEFIELTFVARGYGIHQVEDDSYDIQRGDLYLINPYTKHHILVDDKLEDKDFYLYNIVFDHRFLSHIVRSNPQLKDNKFFSSILQLITDPENAIPGYMSHKLSSDAIRYIEQIFETMFTEYQLMNLDFYNIISAYFVILVAEINRIINFDYYTSAKLMQSSKQLIARAIQYMKDNYPDPIDAQIISDYLHISKNYFCTLFKAVTGTNFVKYLQTLRIKEACLQLSHTTKSVKEIMFDVGYSDPKSFCVLFKKITGKLPSEYRRDFTSAN